MMHSFMFRHNPNGKTINKKHTSHRRNDYHIIRVKLNVEYNFSASEILKTAVTARVLT